MLILVTTLAETTAILILYFSIKEHPITIQGSLLFLRFYMTQWPNIFRKIDCRLACFQIVVSPVVSLLNYSKSRPLLQIRQWGSTVHLRDVHKLDCAIQQKTYEVSCNLYANLFDKRQLVQELNCQNISRNHLLIPPFAGENPTFCCGKSCFLLRKIRPLSTQGYKSFPPFASAIGFLYQKKCFFSCRNCIGPSFILKSLVSRSFF